MKNFLTFILFIFSINSWSNPNKQKIIDSIDFSKQEIFIDSIFLDKINQYRSEHGVEKILFSQIADSLAKSHNKYMILSSTDSFINTTHFEIYGKNKISPDKRIGNKLENVFGRRFLKKETINKSSVDMLNGILNLNNEIINDGVIKSIFDEWENSPLHNKNLLDKNMHKGAISIKFDFEKHIFVADFIAYN